jgi:hypothetical protein
MQRTKILVLVGSISNAYLDKVLMPAAVMLTQKDLKIEVLSLTELPLFNKDFERKNPQIMKGFAFRSERRFYFDSFTRIQLFSTKLFEERHRLFS